VQILMPLIPALQLCS